MILLFGGTSDSVTIARAIAELGKQVLVSTATDEPMAVDSLSGVRRRCGRLDEAGMVALIRDEVVTLVVDATHPYAQEVRSCARAASRKAGVTYLSYCRPASDLESDGLIIADNHDQAAELACSFGRPVLLTTGANNLTMYCKQAQQRNIPLFARVLPRPESIDACRHAGLPDNRIIAAKGPFTVEENIVHITTCRAGVVVAKDSGSAGGLPERLQAARNTDCRVVLIRRPQTAGADDLNFETLMTRIREL